MKDDDPLSCGRLINLLAKEARQGLMEGTAQPVRNKIAAVTRGVAARVHTFDMPDNMLSPRHNIFNTLLEGRGGPDDA